MGLFDNKNFNKNLNVQGIIMTRDKKGRPNGMKVDKNDVAMITAIFAGTAAILGAIFSKDKK